ncbi:c-type cytochrome [bacterium]|nr:c-type cytochrome [bacterium]
MKTLFFLLLTLAPAQSDEFPTPYNSEKDKAAQPPSAKEATASFQVPEGFKTTVFASEPQVQNPIAMAWDHKGRMWVAENFTYAEKGKRFDLKLRDRVIILHDEDGDGEADSRKVFTDKVQMLTSVEVGKDGVWLMCPPQLLFVPDANHDDIPDSEPQVVLDGFTVAQSNYHNLANGLRWGPDGWLYGRCGGSCPGEVGLPGTPKAERVPLRGGIWRFHPTRKTFEVICHGTTNPWGFDWDEHGEPFFINTVNGHLWHAIPGAHFDRPFGRSANDLIYEPIQMHADHWHFDTAGSWQKSRNGAANDFGGGHAHIGMCIYQGGHLPDYWDGKLLTWNQHGRRLNVEKLKRHGSGYLASHEPDAFLSGDEWFRGLDIRTGPEGALYALDWSDTGECHDHTGVHRTSGRIYRFSNGNPGKPELDLLQNITPEKLTKIIKHPNVWFLRRALTQLQFESTSDLIATSRGLLESPNTVIRLRALWVLHAMNAAFSDLGLFTKLVSSEDDYLNVWMLRLLTDSAPIDHVHGPHPAILDEFDILVTILQQLSEGGVSPRIRLEIASTLQRLPLSSRQAVASSLVQRGDPADHNIPKLVWFGIAPLLKDHPESLREIARYTEWPDLLRYISRALASQPDAIIDLAISQPEKAPHILKGLNEGFKGWRKAPLPKNWDKAVETLSKENPALIRELSALFGDGRALDSLREIVFDDKATLPIREKALQGLIDARPDDLRSICEKLLKVRTLNKIAVGGLASFDDLAIAKKLATSYASFKKDERPSVIDALATRPAWANILLDQIAAKRIPRAAVTPYHVRQIILLGDEKLTARLTEIWGSGREVSQSKKQRIAELHRSLTPEVREKADLSAGRIHFQNLCASCHVLYGQGGKLGPDLTGSGRADLGYLLENIVDPSAIVPAEYRMTILKLKDGRSLSGVIASSTEQTITLRALNEETTLERSEVETTTTLENSVMPQGLLHALTSEQTRDLIAYLMHQGQVSLKK